MDGTCLPSHLGSLRDSILTLIQKIDSEFLRVWNRCITVASRILENLWACGPPHAPPRLTIVENISIHMKIGCGAANLVPDLEAPHMCDRIVVGNITKVLGLLAGFLDQKNTWEEEVVHHIMTEASEN